VIRVTRSSTDIAYIELTGGHIGYSEGLVVTLPSGQIQLLALDFGTDDRLIGIELQGASVGLPDELEAGEYRLTHKE